MTDDSFHLIVNELKVLKEKEPKLAAVIMAMRDDDKEEFLKKEVSVLFPPGGCMDAEKRKDTEKRKLLRRKHDIMLDVINLLSASVRKEYFFHSSFDVLSENEKKLKGEGSRKYRKTKSCRRVQCSRRSRSMQTSGRGEPSKCVTFQAWHCQGGSIRVE